MRLEIYEDRSWDAVELAISQSGGWLIRLSLRSIWWGGHRIDRSLAGWWSRAHAPLRNAFGRAVNWSAIKVWKLFYGR